MRAPGLRAWVENMAPARALGEVTVAFVTDGWMRRLNRECRGVDRVTDVLSFQASEAPARHGEPLGDIVIASGVARRQARRAKHPLGVEVRVLALHGLLHLLGYDHETDDGAMARFEARLRRQGGLGTGLIERAVSPKAETVGERTRQNRPRGGSRRPRASDPGDRQTPRARP
ncbi:MAG: rRNA maturation RNase YbeY [Acidobacteriota bacterium]